MQKAIVVSYLAIMILLGLALRSRINNISDSLIAGRNLGILRNRGYDSIRGLSARTFRGPVQRRPGIINCLVAIHSSVCSGNSYDTFSGKKNHDKSIRIQGFLALPYLIRVTGLEKILGKSLGDFPS